MIRAVLFCAALTVMIAGSLFLWVQGNLSRPLSYPAPFTYEIPKGVSLHAIEADLYKNAILTDRFGFRIATHILRMKAPIHAGEYTIPEGLSTRDLLALFQAGSNVQYFLTVIEGRTSHEIVAQLRAHPDLTGIIDRVPAEGRLLPETYSFQKGEDRTAILDRMKMALNKALDTAWEKRLKGLPLRNKHEALTLASIIEKETAMPEERRRVSGVFINRLRKGMKLQTDPTVIYGITGGKHAQEGRGPLDRRLLRKDLKHPSPYNTYQHTGLPPGPIANVGVAALEAAVTPEAHDYLYFVANGKGGHAFARTFKAHQRNVERWRKIRK